MLHMAQHDTTSKSFNPYDYHKCSQHRTSLLGSLRVTTKSITLLLPLANEKREGGRQGSEATTHWVIPGYRERHLQGVVAKRPSLLVVFAQPCSMPPRVFMHPYPLELPLVTKPREEGDQNAGDKNTVSNGLWCGAAQGWVDSVKSVTSHDFLTQSSQVTSHAAPVDSVKSLCRVVTVTE